MKKYPLMPAQIYLPKSDFARWSVVACDQFTSQPEYWDEVEKIVGDCPSTLKITLPEIYLSGDVEARIGAINANMEKYLSEGVISARENAMIYVERQMSDGSTRCGIVGAIDLEDYDYHIGSKTPIRATEKTVLERIPPRVKIRENASLELPHVLLMIDDPKKTVVEAIGAVKDRFEKAYDVELMMGGGRIVGYFLDDDAIAMVGEALEAMKTDDGMLFAVGDGNHSLATAKACYQKNPTPASRYALVEVVNTHSEAIVFEPIYRVVFNVDPAALKKALIAACGESGASDAQKFEILTADGRETVSLCPASKLPVGTLQGFLDEYLPACPGAEIDYIHGTDVVEQLCKKENTIGFIFEGMQKDELFAAVEQDGSLPRKTFSMGQARDKRYYMECRKIK